MHNSFKSANLFPFRVESFTSLQPHIKPLVDYTPSTTPKNITTILPSKEQAPTFANDHPVECRPKQPLDQVSDEKPKSSLKQRFLESHGFNPTSCKQYLNILKDGSYTLKIPNLTENQVLELLNRFFNHYNHF